MRPLARTALLVAITACAPAGPRTTPPTFQEYHVEKYTGPTAPLVYDDPPKEQQFGAEIAATVALGPMFAGEMSYAIGHCGDGCNWPALVNLRTGRVVVDSVLWPTCGTFDFRPTSRLVVVTPKQLGTGEVYGNCVDKVSYYEWKDDHFVAIPVAAPAP